VTLSEIDLSLPVDDDDKLVWMIREVMIGKGSQNTGTETLVPHDKAPDI
jgi:hypothetical protein